MNKELNDARAEIDRLKSSFAKGQQTHSGSFGARSTSATTNGFEFSNKTSVRSPQLLNKKTFVSDLTNSEPQRKPSPQRNEAERVLKIELDQTKKELKLAMKNYEAEAREKESLKEEIAKCRSEKQRFNKSDLDALTRELEQIKKSRDLDEKRH